MILLAVGGQLLGRYVRSRGTTANRQRDVYTLAIDGSAEHMEALCSVVDWLIAETRVGK
tara:strand:+ start:694 stop:870 length:177 start_codon:yes stop_codon:yes gene_type:complete